MSGKLLRSGKTLPSLEGLRKAETVEQSTKKSKGEEEGGGHVRPQAAQANVENCA